MNKIEAFRANLMHEVEALFDEDSVPGMVDSVRWRFDNNGWITAIYPITGGVVFLPKDTAGIFRLCDGHHNVRDIISNGARSGVPRETVRRTLFLLFCEAFVKVHPPTGKWVTVKDAIVRLSKKHVQNPSRSKSESKRSKWLEN